MFFKHFITEVQENMELKRLIKIDLLRKKLKLLNNTKSNIYEVKIIFSYLN